MQLPKIIDLFSGCGGLSLGFKKAGFDIVGGVELMPEACQTIRNNFDDGKDDIHLQKDITKLDESVFDNRIGKEGCIVIGGPPCQAYSLAGRGKLKSLGEDRVNTSDPRGYLFLEYLRFVYHLKAKAVVMENVPEATNYGGINIPQMICDELESNGYRAIWTILNAADYGVPQARERVFVVALRKDLPKFKLPHPTNGNLKIQTFNQRRFESLKKCKNFVIPNLPTENTDAWVTIGDAFSDLPQLMKSCFDKYERKALNVGKEYRSLPKNSFQQKMRDWNESGNYLSSVTAIAFKNNRRDFPIFEKMKMGDNFIDASNIADGLFRSEYRRRGFAIDSDEYKDLRKKMVPPYDRTKFENKWKKLDETKPSHTVTAHLEKDTYSHIHPWEPRGISVREAARLQSFPDSFTFDCTMGNAYKQIGNAVPPLLALAVAESLKKVFEGENDEK